MKPASGFSLIELSIVLFIGAVLLTAGLRALNTQLDNSAYSTTKTRQEIIKDALSIYLGKNGRLPCPDTSATPDGFEDRDPATNPRACLKSFGVVPYAELGLSKEVAVDGWENFMAYGVSPQWTLTYIPPPNAVTPNAPQTNNPANAFLVGYSGALTISDRINGALTNTTTTAVVVLISYGKNGNGAITVKGSQNVRPVAGTNDDELMNVNVSGTGTQYVKRDYTDSQVAPYGAFDDLVRVVQATDLISPLTKDGSLQSSTGSAIQTISAISSAIVDETIKTYIPGTPYYLPSSIPLSVPSSLDPWGHSIVYTPDPKLLGPVASGPCADANSGISFCTATPTIAYTLRSWGPDGATGGASTADDIVVSVPLTQIKNVLNKIGY